MILASLFLLIFFYNITQIKEKVSIALAVSTVCLTFLVGMSDSYPLSIILPNTIGKFLLNFKIISQFLVLVCTTYLYFVLSSFITLKILRILTTAFFSILTCFVLLTYHLPLPTHSELYASGTLLLFHRVRHIDDE